MLTLDTCKLFGKTKLILQRVYSLCLDCTQRNLFSIVREQSVWGKALVRMRQPAPTELLRITAVCLYAFVCLHHKFLCHYGVLSIILCHSYFKTHESKLKYFTEVLIVKSKSHLV